MTQNKLPKDWKVVKLGELCDKMANGANAKQFEDQIGLPISRIETIWNEDIDLKRVKYIYENDEAFIEKYALKKNDILFSHINSDIHLGKTALFKNQTKTLIHGINLLLIRLCKEAQPDFFNYQFNYKRRRGEFITIASKSVNQSSINQPKLKNIDFVLPPLETQQNIVSKIEELFSELDKGIEDIKTAQQQLKIYRQSVLKWAFEGKLTKEWRKRGTNLNTASILLNKIQVEKENEAKRIGKKLKPTNSLTVNDISQLSKLPENWRWVSLGEVISDLTDYHANGSYVKIKENVELLDIPNYAIMIRATNFEKNNFNENLKYITENAYNYMSRSKLFGGEILIGKIGNAGRIYFMPTLKSPSSLAMNLFALRFNVDVNKYVYYHLLSSFSKQEISKYVKGVGNPTIDKNSIRSLSIALPSFEEQYQIVQEIESRLSVADKMEESITQSLQQAETLRQSILKKAFSGELI